ncbi:phosphotransferase [Streptomyces sp. AK02-01A]|uniref:phosphotransferase n=1 Tax=Streptomyces sp. AK02-01A TaxID=3028648 RepID=UPI0029B6A1FF|nr:phosphotransferase [Streptomyces sp. AK02-01A]MDX3850638.1 phosphotransferase [Streptomyces sp. AK02-01A]
MEIIVRNTVCPQHPDTSVGVLSRVRDAVLDGTLGHVTVFTGETAAENEETALWPGVLRHVVAAEEKERSRSLTGELRDGSGSVLILDCACDIRAGVLPAFANLGTATVLVTEREDLGNRLYAMTRREGKLALILEGLGTSGAFGYLGALFLTERDRAALCAILEEGGFRLPWQTVVSRLAQRTRVQCAALTRDVHGKDVVVGSSLAGGSHARTYIRLHPASGRRTVRKEAVGAGCGKLTEEIGWLHGLEATAGRHFPDVVESRIESHGVSMDLAYHHLPTLRRLILAGEVDEEEAARWTRRTLATLRRDLYPVGHRSAPDDYVRRTHLDRIERRLAETAAALPDRRRLWTADTVRVNGVSLRGVQHLVTAVANDQEALRILTPERLVRTHGDPHFDNILIDRDNHRFFLIDPRGNSGYDVAYDLGKIWHSVNSLYDLIHDGHVRVEAGDDEINYTFTSPRLVAFYRGVRERVHAWLLATNWAQDDAHWLLKVRLAEAAHMCSVMPFHIVRDARETVALACYARGLELLNSLYEDVTAATATARVA